MSLLPLSRGVLPLLPAVTAVLLAGCSTPTAGPVTPGPGPRPARLSQATPTAEEAARFQVAERKSGDWTDTGEPPSASAGRSLGGPMEARALASASAPADSAEMAAGAPAPAAMPASPARPSLSSKHRGSDGDSGDPLEAGEVDDNLLHEKYLAYAAKAEVGDRVHRFDARERYRIWVTDREGRGLADSEVQLRRAEGENAGSVLFRGRTSPGGEVLFFPDALISEGYRLPERLELVAESGGRTGSESVTRNPRGGNWTVRVDGASQAQGLTLDLLFLVDTTGSMSEEIQRVRDTIQSVSARIRSLPSRPALRLGIVLYRDKGDEYVTRRRPFTTDVDQFQAALADVRADGGGDEPEHLNAGLQQAVEAMDWTERNAVRMAFVIADAPPHLDYQDEYDYFLAGRRAVEKGIQIIGVSTMGTNDVGEFVFRQLALLTGGRFVFVTRGGPAGITPHHVDRSDYSVQKLDDLIVRLVSERLALLGTRPGQQARDR